MIFSKTSKIAIKAVSHLTSQNNVYVHHSIKELAEAIEESEHTLGKTLQILVKAEIIHSNKGPNGGFFMEPKQLEFPLLKIVEAIEGKFIFNKCVLGYKKCGSRNPCALHTEFKFARANVEKILTRTKISNLVTENTGREFFS